MALAAMPSRCTSGQRCLSFGEAIGFVGLAVVGLVAHELSTERIVHAFEAIPADARDGRRSEDLQAAA